MKIPVSLSKGLNKEQLQQLERELKNSILVKRLREDLKKRIEANILDEEVLTNLNIEEIARCLGERRGYRDVLKLLPEE